MKDQHVLFSQIRWNENMECVNVYHKVVNRAVTIVWRHTSKKSKKLFHSVYDDSMIKQMYDREKLHCIVFLVSLCFLHKSTHQLKLVLIVFVNITYSSSLAFYNEYTHELACLFYKLRIDIYWFPRNTFWMLLQITGKVCTRLKSACMQSLHKLRKNNFLTFVGFLFWYAWNDVVLSISGHL